MNIQGIHILYLYIGISATIIIGCLLYLCYIARQIQRKLPPSDANEYLIQKQLGNKERAYYHLQRDFIIQSGKRNLETFEIRAYYEKFTELDLGIPDFEELNKLKILEMPEQGHDGEWI